MVKHFLTFVFDIKSFLTIESPTLPKANPNTILAKYGKAARNPVCPMLKPSTVDMNFGPAVIRKNKPQRLPNCATHNAHAGTETAIDLYGGIR